MAERPICEVCGTDCTGEDDFQQCYLGDIYLPGLYFDGHVNLCERCKQKLDTLVERFLEGEEDPQRLPDRIEKLAQVAREAELAFGRLEGPTIADLDTGARAVEAAELKLLTAVKNWY